jgi:hypothetical protein
MVLGKLNLNADIYELLPSNQDFVFVHYGEFIQAILLPDEFDIVLVVWKIMIPEDEYFIYVHRSMHMYWVSLVMAG